MKDKKTKNKYVFSVIQLYIYQMEVYKDDNWKWVNCSFVIATACKQKNGQVNLTFQSLEPQMEFNDAQGDPHELQVQIYMIRQFHIQEQKGFMWHKNCYIPEFNISFRKDQLQLLEESEIGDVICEVTSVTIVEGNEIYLKKVDLEGQCKKKIQSETIQFVNLKFSSTSFHHDKAKFSLLIWIYFINQQGKRVTLKALISSQVYVDSRKEARKKINVKTLLLTKTQLTQFDQPIQIKVKGDIKKLSNSAQSFIHFYSAQNIRNKIKHPFYLGYHFSNVFKVYYNEHLCDDVDDCLAKMLKTDKYSVKILLILIKAPEQCKKKIISLFETWRFFFAIVTFEEQHTNYDTKWALIPPRDLREHYLYFYQEQQLKKEQEVKIKKENQSERRQQFKRQSSTYQYHQEFVISRGNKIIKTLSKMQ